MIIDDIKLINFRNYKQLECSFHPNLNIIFGKNGSGKTNLVEAIYVLALTRSFRNVNDRTLIMDTASTCKIEGNVQDKSLTNYRVLISKDGKKVKINNNKVAKISDYISKINIVLFHPDDLRFIKDTPSTRRKSLNISISQINLKYLRYLNNYNILLKQRNAYLKQMLVNGNHSSDYLGILTDKLIDYGIYIRDTRKEYLEHINEYISDIYYQITNEKDFKLEYESDYLNLKKEDIVKLYASSLQKDLAFGKTNIGIHTDEIRFLYLEKDLKDYGSEGQQKNAVIAYKLSEIEIFKKMTGKYPLLILDDLFSELDEEKINHILKLLKKEVQTFITTTDISHFNHLDEFQYKSFEIVNGKIEEEENHE